MGSSHYSDEFIAYAKEEDAINHQHTSNWIPCYAFITALPIIFIACAVYSNRKRAAEKKKLATKPGKWWNPMAITITRRPYAGRSSSANHDDNQGESDENIEMTDLEAADTTMATKATVAIMGTATSGTARGMAGNLATTTTKTTTTTMAARAETAPRSRAASIVASDTGAVLAGGEFLEDVDLERCDGIEEGRMMMTGGSRRPQRSGRARGRAHHPVPSWRRQTALPGEFSAFQFQPPAGDWPRYEDLVLEHAEAHGNTNGERSQTTDNIRL